MNSSKHYFTLVILTLGILSCAVNKVPQENRNVIEIDLSTILVTAGGELTITPTIDPASDEHFNITIVNTNPSDFEVNFIPVDSHPLKIKDGGKKMTVGFVSIEPVSADITEEVTKTYKVRIPKEQSIDKALYISTFSSLYPLHYEKSRGIPHSHNRAHMIGDPRFY